MDNREPTERVAAATAAAIPGATSLAVATDNCLHSALLLRDMEERAASALGASVAGAALRSEAEESQRCWGVPPTPDISGRPRVGSALLLRDNWAGCDIAEPRCGSGRAVFVVADKRPVER